MSCEEAFIKQLREAGFRLTPQREMVLSVMHDIEGHATADEIYARVQKLSASVDISTVYRTLELLQDFRMVACLELDDGQRHYQLLGVHGSHCHLVCRSCGKLIGVKHSVVQPLLETLMRDHDFLVDEEELMIPGLCGGCRAQREGEKGVAAVDRGAPA